MSTRYFFWGLLVCFALGFSLPSVAEEPAGVSEEAYAVLMDNEVLDLQDLADGAEIQRRFFNRITPPNFSWLQPMFPSVVPFDAKYFDESFLDGLLGEDTNSVAVYPLSLVLDPKTRETLVYNAEGKLIASVPSDGIARTWPADADPARVTLKIDLLPAEDVEPFLYVEDRISESLASVVSKTAKSPRTGGVAMRSLTAGQFGIADIQRLTNGNFRLTVTNGTDVAEVFSYTVWHTSSVVVVTWTNEESNVVTDTNTLWTPISPPFNGLESEWDFGTTNLVLTNGVGVWEDSNISTNARVRFYGVAERADADHDSLTDGAELFVYHTSPTNRDTDGDGWSDGEELTEETDPLDRFSATRLAKGVMIHGVCYNPSNGLAASNQWLQLHSSSASPVNLGDFRLQVAGSNYATKLSFPSNTWIQPGHFILVGGSNVAGSDYLASLDLPNSYSTNPTAGARLVGPDGVDADPADVVMYGTHSPFNEGGLPTNGWGSTNTDLWAGRSNQLVRTRLGQDADLRSDWTYRLVGDLWNSEIILDSDGDGLTDGEEYSGSEANGVQSDPLDPDTDSDGLEDGFEADHGLNPANSDSDGDSIEDPDEINPETGNTYLEDQLGTDVSVSIDSSLPGWILGQSIGSNGWVKFTLTDWDGMGVWATIKEGGDEPEAFTNSIANATVAYSTNIYNGGFRTLHLLLISTNHAVPIEITVNDGGTYWTNQTPITLGPDIFAHFDAVDISIERIFSEQLPTRECNSLPAPEDGPNDPMLMGAVNSTQATISVQMIVVPEGLPDIVQFGTRMVSAPSTIIASRLCLPYPEKALLSYTPEGVEYEVVFGVDADSDGFSSEDVLGAFPQYIRVATMDSYNDSIAAIFGSYTYLTGWAEHLANQFIYSDGVLGSLVPYYSGDVEIAAGDLSHPLGQVWDASCEGECRFYEYASTSTLSSNFAATKQVEDVIEAALSQYEAEVGTFFSDTNSPSEHQFTGWSWTGSIGTTAWLSFPPNLEFFGAFGGIGGMTGTMSVTVRKIDGAVLDVTYSGSFVDSYDFNIKSQYNTDGAIVQAGYNTLGSAGRTFQSGLQFERTTDDIDYNFSIGE